MRTLQFKSEFKQKENSMETMDIFVPLAYYIGAYRIKSELEDLSLQYLYPDKYKKIEDIKLKIEDDSKKCLQEMLMNIKNILSDKIYVYTTKGEIIELPKGSTAIDFAYKIHSDIGDTMVSAIVNDKMVDPDYVLHNKK
mgnify:CR=1 FL=1